MIEQKNTESGLGLLTLLIIGSVLAISAGILIGSFKNSTDLTQKIKTNSLLAQSNASLENFIRYSPSCSLNISKLITQDTIRDFVENRQTSLKPSINQLLMSTGYYFVSINRQSLLNQELKVNIILQKDLSQQLLIPMLFTVNGDQVDCASNNTAPVIPTNQSLSDFCQTTGMHDAACQLTQNTQTLSCPANHAIIGFEKVDGQVRVKCSSTAYQYDSRPVSYCPSGKYKIIKNRQNKYQLALIAGCSSVFNPSDDTSGDGVIVTNPTNQCTFANLCRHSSHLDIRGPFSQSQCNQNKSNFINQSGNPLIHTQCVPCDQNYYLCTSDS